MTALVICVLHFRPICNDVILDPHREQRLPYFVPANARAYLWQLAIVWPSKLNQTHASVIGRYYDEFALADYVEFFDQALLKIY